MIKISVKLVLKKTKLAFTEQVPQPHYTHTHTCNTLCIVLLVKHTPHT